jgi:hypothetical protein
LVATIWVPHFGAVLQNIHAPASIPDFSVECVASKTPPSLPTLMKRMKAAFLYDLPKRSNENGRRISDQMADEIARVTPSSPRSGHPPLFKAGM